MIAQIAGKVALKQAGTFRGLKLPLIRWTVSARLNRLRKKGKIRVELRKSTPQGLKPRRFVSLYAGVKTPAYLKTEFFRSL
jgi:hypothetical protein